MGWRTLVIILLSLILLMVLVLGGRWLFRPVASIDTVNAKLSQIEQDPSRYVTSAQPTVTVSPAQQAQLIRSFLELYFSPWDDEARSAASTAKILGKIQQERTYFLQQPGWQFTTQTFSTQDIQDLLNNADLTGYPQINRPGIIVHVTEARVFPTLLPAYGNPQQAGQGYPFDNWIDSYIFPGTPVRILQQSKDNLWYLLKTASYYGWVLKEDVGFVSPEFISEWKKYPFVIAPHDQVNSRLRKGLLYPLIGEQGEQLKLLTPFLTTNGDAQIQTVLINNSDARPFPLPLTAAEIAEFSRDFLGGQYGWGSLYELRDCSATTADIFAPFGVWLPRNSLQQSKTGKIISLANMSSAEKLRVFAEQAIPFFTLVHLPGHVALFIGMHDGQAYVLQDVWGLHTEDLFNREGRAIIGRTVITPLDFGKEFRNVKKTQLEAADSISILIPDAYVDSQAIQQAIW